MKTNENQEEQFLAECLHKNPNLVFVFGSNLSGRHGAGAARYAMYHFNATYGQGIGLQGQAYAIPTKDAHLNTLPLSEIQKYVNDFLVFARLAHHLSFFVTRIGCGLAGYNDNQIAPFFAGAPSNCILPNGWEAMK